MTSSPRLTLAYDPLSRDLTHAYDRRRVVWWARQRGISLNQVSDGDSGVVFLHSQSDLPRWVARKRQQPEIRLAIDLVDGYLMAEPSLLEDYGRSAVRMVNRDFSRTTSRYTSWLRRAAEVADVVICSSPEQAAFLQTLNGNVHPILDWHGELPLLPSHERRQQSIGGSIFWEGQSATLKHLIDLAGPLQRASCELPLQLNVVTDPRVPMIGPRTLGPSSSRLLDKAFSDSNVEIAFYRWTPRNVEDVAASCDFAVLPISSQDSFARAKPENRLLIAWRLGLPCLTSDTPAYSRVMADAEVEGTCHDAEDWESVLLAYARDRDLRTANIGGGQAYLARNHSDAQLLARWDSALMPLFS